MFTLNIGTDNEAFAENPAAEVARILSDVAHYLTAGHGGEGIRSDDGGMRDINGNTVGKWSLDAPANPRAGHEYQGHPQGEDYCTDDDNEAGEQCGLRMSQHP